MTEPAKRVPKWLRLDLSVLVVGTVITIATTLWLEPNRDSAVHRIAHSAQSTGHLLWHYISEHKKPAVPKLKGPL